MHEVISEYTLGDAIDDGLLVPVFQNRWQQLSFCKPIVATSSIHSQFSKAAIMEMWNAFVDWVKYEKADLKPEDRLFRTRMNGKEIWVIEDPQAYTLMFPSDY
jgi:hypothetical protein